MGTSGSTQFKQLNLQVWSQASYVAELTEEQIIKKKYFDPIDLYLTINACDIIFLCPYQIEARSDQMRLAP